MASELMLYVRVGCSLCEAMVEELAPYRDRLQVREVDVDADPATVERYGLAVPVLVAPGECEVCRYFLDPERLEPYLK